MRDSSRENLMLHKKKEHECVDTYVYSWIPIAFYCVVSESIEMETFPKKKEKARNVSSSKKKERKKNQEMYTKVK